MTERPLSERMRDVPGTRLGGYLVTDSEVSEVAALESRLAAAEAANKRLREALHPGPMPTTVESLLRRDSSGTWTTPLERLAADKNAPDDPREYWGTYMYDWAVNANRYEALTGLDAVTGEGRE